MRTFAPFVAGVGTMEYGKFLVYNVVGGVVWITIFTLAGYFFGNVAFIQEHFHYVIVAIIVLSLAPMVYEYIQTRQHPDVPGVGTKKLKKFVNK